MSLKNILKPILSSFNKDAFMVPNFDLGDLNILYRQSAGKHLFRDLESKNLDVIEYLKNNKSLRDRFSNEYSKFHFEYAQAIRPFLPKSPKSILDIGCGLGVISLFLFKSTKCKMYMLDSESDETVSVTGFHKDGYIFTAKMAACAQFLQKNGISKDRIELIDIAKDPFPEAEMDVIISKRSWGFHYPLSEYLEKCRGVLSDSGCIVVDVRKNALNEDTLNSYAKYFDIKILIDEQKSKTIIMKKV